MSLADECRKLVAFLNDAHQSAPAFIVELDVRRTRLEVALATNDAREAEIANRGKLADDLAVACEGLITAMIQLDKDHHREVLFAKVKLCAYREATR